MSQQPGWQPTRVPANNAAKPLASQAPATMQQTYAQQAVQPQEPASGIALRWRPVSRGPACSSANAASPASVQHSIDPTSVVQASTSAVAGGQPNQRVAPAVDWAANPLRDNQVRVANYQTQSSPPGTFTDPFGDTPPLALPPANLPPANLPSLPPSQPLNPPSIAPADPLSNLELPPMPGETLDKRLPNAAPEELFPGLQRDDAKQDASPFDKRPEPNLGNEKPASPAEQVEPEEEPSSLEIPKRNKNANTISCNELRGRPFTKRLTDINLNVSPGYGEGRQASQSDSQQRRLDFAASAPAREWTDYTGVVVANGRLVDLRNDFVILDVNGAERIIPIRDLSDIDVAYVAEAWNLPSKCGLGYESYAGRNFIASAVEWKASGLCHKPLYFEEVQLERYGHEVGPVLQPLISSAHFFGNILILPYKMGIHPPGECQYALGYYRPGDCAPYMIPPFPLSLRGAAVQAGFVTGAAALIP